MALKTVFVAFMLLLAIYSQTTLGHDVKCENLDEDTCAFAVSSTGKRCVLEKSVRRSGIEVYTCRSSEIEADKVTNIIESDECIKECGLDRKSLGISSDALLESQFTQKLCSVKCLNQCPNVVDLFFNLAAGEGVYLPKLCESQEGKSRRAMSEIRSSGIVMDTLGPVGPVRLGEIAPEPATPMDHMPSVPAPSPY
ncbi:PAR1 [Arabidopsis suecica]|uniref:PAR1 n=1 Tax=Arabidopsis suecica TaxID=45249 RepID=A0A8T1XXU4_ARASU|nr:PAR1 [Arabidopsis suecica]